MSTGRRDRLLVVTSPHRAERWGAAKVLAADAGRDLLVVDVAKLVSRWVGETEKNLATVLEAAERSRAVLFFDEADALFGRRTGVRGAHDRYANLEVSHLLSGVEAHPRLSVVVVGTTRVPRTCPSGTRVLDLGVAPRRT